MHKKTQLLLLFLLIINLSFIPKSKRAQLQKENIAQRYSTTNPLNPLFKVFHLNDSSTVVYYQLNFDDFVYNPIHDSMAFEANYRLKYELYNNYEGKFLLDSASMHFHDQKHYKSKSTSLGYFEVAAKIKNTYVLKLVLEDLNADQKLVQLIEINKTSKLNRQNFYLLAPDGLPVMGNYVNKNEKFSIIYNNLKTKVLHVKFFRDLHTAALPPSSNKAKKMKEYLSPDSSFSISIQQGKSETISFKKQGIYHIMADKDHSEGFSIKVFTSGYPFISTATQMMMPLRYITSKKEFNTILNAKDKKSEIDRFWLSISSESTRAKSHLTSYYQHVQLANLLFESDREGWMTDRGMIYIVYGPPDLVFRNNEMETWVYGGASKQRSSRFNFIKANNPFTDNDYRLDRSLSYQNSWNLALDLWRR